MNIFNDFFKNIIACIIFNGTLFTTMKLLFTFIGELLQLALRSSPLWGKVGYPSWEQDTGKQ